MPVGDGLTCPACGLRPSPTQAEAYKATHRCPICGAHAPTFRALLFRPLPLPPPWQGLPLPPDAKAAPSPINAPPTPKRKSRRK